ncbi:MAG TPA: hypothetical protein GXZ65_09160 [Clostridiales bacterium]|jgi:Na+/H+ antiporter NhaD/arsenite permease-like protein|nr:hypothetical protein [Clostridiales bacterium]
MTNVLIFFLGFVLAIVIGQVFKINAGFVAIFFGFLLNWIIAKGTATDFIKLFPVTLFWNYGIPIMFYAFAAANGTLSALGNKVIWRFRSNKWVMSIAVLCSAAIVAACGAGTNNTLILAPLAWPLCIIAGIPYLLIPFSLWCGSFIGSFLPWTSNGAMHAALIGQNIPGIDVAPQSWRIFMFYCLFAILVYIIAFVALKGWKTRDHASDAELKEPEPLNPVHKKTLAIIIIMIALLLIPLILNTFAPSPVWKWMSGNLSITVTSILGISLMGLLKLGNLREVFSKHVNWEIIFTITGMGMYCALSRGLGVDTALGEWLPTLSPSVIAPAFVLVGAALSFVVSATAVLPLLYSLAPIVGPAAGLSPAALIVPIVVGVGVTSFSPFSVGGATALIGAPPEVSNKLVPQQIACAIGMALFGVLLAFTGMFTVGA